MASVRFTPIVPRKPIADQAKAKQVEAQMRQWAGTTQRKVADYPTQQPTTYRRTGTLGHNTAIRVGGDAGDLRAVVQNATSYAPYVIGSRTTQSRRMRGKGWKTMGEIGFAEWQRTRALIVALLGNK